MAKSFLCYLHKPGVLAPELRVIACEREQDLPDQILAELPEWGEFDKIDVYTDANSLMFSFTSGPQVQH
jgi:hypothetical protein